MTKYTFTIDLPPTNCKKGDVVDTHKHGKAMFATWLALGYIEEVKEEEWPKVGDIYYYVNDHAVVCYEKWYDHSLDKSRKEVGNCHHTLGEALQAGERVKRAYKGI